jgi:multicomponent Na+:H+ antiporter subunit B
MITAILRYILTMGTLVMIGAALTVAFTEAPAPDAPLGEVAQVYNAQTVAETSATNVIAAINFDWRAYDTIGEATILMAAVTGVGLLMRRYLERRRETGIS